MPLLNSLFAPALFGMSFLMCLLFLYHQRDTSTGVYSALLCFLASFLAFSLYLPTIDNISIQSLFYPAINIAPYLWGPTLWLYVKKSLRQKTNYVYIHFTPAIFAGFIVFFSQQSWLFLLSVLVYLHIYFYLFSCLRVLVAFIQSTKNSHEKVITSTSKWLLIFLSIFSVFLIVDGGLFFAIILGFNVLVPAYTIIILFESLLIFLLSTRGFYINQLYSKKLGDSRKSELRLNVDTAQQLKDILYNIMLKSKPYKDNNLSLNELAKIIQVSKHELSELLNEHLHVSFYEFINNYRVDYACDLLVDSLHKNTNLLDIAFQAGFGNKTTFNKEFKKRKNVTPSQFRNNNIDLTV